MKIIDFSKCELSNRNLEYTPLAQESQWFFIDAWVPKRKGNWPQPSYSGVRIPLHAPNILRQLNGQSGRLISVISVFNSQSEDQSRGIVQKLGHVTLTHTTKVRILVPPPMAVLFSNSVRLISALRKCDSFCSHHTHIAQLDQSKRFLIFRLRVRILLWVPRYGQVTYMVE